MTHCVILWLQLHPRPESRKPLQHRQLQKPRQQLLWQQQQKAAMKGFAAAAAAADAQLQEKLAAITGSQGSKPKVSFACHDLSCVVENIIALLC